MSFFRNMKLKMLQLRKKKQLDIEMMKALEADILKSKDELKYIDNYKNWRKTEEVDKKVVSGGIIGKIIAPKKKIMALFFMRDGTCNLINADSSKQYFEYEKNNYFIDPVACVFVGSLESYLAFYHENVSLPINFTEGMKTLLHDIANKKIKTEINLALESKVFERFIKSEFVQKLMSGAELASELFFLKFMSIIQTIIMVLLFIMSIVIIFIAGRS